MEIPVRVRRGHLLNSNTQSKRTIHLIRSITLVWTLVQHGAPVFEGGRRITRHTCATQRRNRVHIRFFQNVVGTTSTRAEEIRKGRSAIDDDDVADSVVGVSNGLAKHDIHHGQGSRKGELSHDSV